MFKRITAHRGGDLIVTIPTNGRMVTRLTQAVVTSGTGAIVARFEQGTSNGFDLSLQLRANQTSRMSGTYKFAVFAEIDGVVENLQYGILTVL